MECFTIIIPTHNRPDFLNRILDYYSEYDIKIIVADSSDLKFENNQKHKIKYFHTPNLNYYEKIHKVIELVKTKYVLLCADDDFIIVSAIIKCIKFLEENPKYYSAQGNSVNFYNSTKLSCYPSLIYTAGLNISGDNPKDRINQLFETYIFLHYSVHRTINLKETFKLSLNLTKASYSFVQYFLDIICIINGKHTVLPIFYGAREIMKNSATYTLSKLQSAPEITKENENLIELLSNHLKHKENLDENSSRKIISDVFNSSPYFNKPSIISEKLSSPIKNKRIKSIVNQLPFIDNIKNYYSIIIHNQSKKRNIYHFEAKSSKLKKMTKNIPGFPFYETESNLEWLKIKKIIKKHGRIKL